MSAAHPAPPAETAPPALPAVEIARALDVIFARLIDLLWTRARYALLLGPLAGLVATRLARTRLRLACALARIIAGTPAQPPRPRATTRRRGAAIPFPNRRFAWLAAMLDHDVRNIASQFATLLHQPSVAETLAASPGATRTLRPLCRMLGIELPPPLRLPAPAPPQPKATPPRPIPSLHPALRPAPRPAPRPPPLPPLNPPIQPYVLAAARAWQRRGPKNA